MQNTKYSIMSAFIQSVYSKTPSNKKSMFTLPLAWENSRVFKTFQNGFPSGGESSRHLIGWLESKKAKAYSEKQSLNLDMFSQSLE